MLWHYSQFKYPRNKMLLIKRISTNIIFQGNGFMRRLRELNVYCRNNMWVVTAVVTDFFLWDNSLSLNGVSLAKKVVKYEWETIQCE